MLLYSNGFLSFFYVRSNKLCLHLRFAGSKSIIRNIYIISKKGHRFYTKNKTLNNKYRHNSFCIVNTSTGFKLTTDLRILGYGGEPLFEIAY